MTAWLFRMAGLGRVFLVLALVAGMSGAGRAESLQAFGPGSYQHIVERYAGRPFVLVLWSVDCPPCHAELEMLGKWWPRNSQAALVLVATDDAESTAEVTDNLRRYGLMRADTWQFADGPVERLRYEIDPAWRGELPRSYFFAGTQQRSGVSGRLKQEVLEQWLKDTAG